jgi:hypothetical protein
MITVEQLEIYYWSKRKKKVYSTGSDSAAKARYKVRANTAQKKFMTGKKERTESTQQ